ncbi:BsuPI-related putative proteinase inhibitor [Neobacillus kokaensis]|uniref:Intracellular proteinase inhibitor BsuPI domain-containing protein n=1 Tax=Neobacillus kokaensis TaxID=2759023 RepID=A0ABQ3N5L9_9BACI|nr:BsuPI-related putative proteinase inhibitor [Neobacillus kokaensis]GHH99298.1 hypothetical protein AM1BK_28410 [Neobacillus kokaensis]
MVNKKFSYFVCSALAIGLLSGCGSSANVDKQGSSGSSSKTETPAKNEVAAKFQAKVEIKEENDDVAVLYKVKNLSGAAKKLSFSSGLEADFILYDHNGHILKRYSEEILSTQALKEVMLENNQEIDRVFKIPGLVNGSYKIEVFLLAKEEQAKAVTEFQVRNSIYKQGNGQLVGLMDPHTIEVNMDGEAIAFQLSDQAREEITSFNDGDPVSFIYIENDKGQKVIEWFNKNN